MNKLLIALVVLVAGAAMFVLRPTEDLRTLLLGHWPAPKAIDSSRSAVSSTASTIPDEFVVSEIKESNATVLAPAVAVSSLPSNGAAETNIGLPAPNGTLAVDGEKGAQLLRDLRKWSTQNFTAALAWVLRMPESGDREEAMAAICFGLAERNPAQAMRTAISYHLGDSEPEAVQILMEKWAMADRWGALNWARVQPAGEGRDQFISRVAYVLSQSDPAAASRLVREEIHSSLQEEAVMSVLHQWVRTDFRAASAWVETFPEGTMRDRASREIRGMDRQTLGVGN